MERLHKTSWPARIVFISRLRLCRLERLAADDRAGVRKDLPGRRLYARGDHPRHWFNALLGAACRALLFSLFGSLGFGIWNLSGIWCLEIYPVGGSQTTPLHPEIAVSDLLLGTACRSLADMRSVFPAAFTAMINRYIL